MEVQAMRAVCMRPIQRLVMLERMRRGIPKQLEDKIELV